MPRIDSMRDGVSTFKIRAKRLMLKSGFVVSFLAQVWDIGLNLSAQIEWGGVGFVTLSPYIAQLIALLMCVVGYRMVDKVLPLADKD